MNWFIAKLIFRIDADDALNTAQFDEQLRLIDAVSRDLAIEVAHQIGLTEQESLKTKKGTDLYWKFVAVTEIEYLGDIANGKEIHYRIHEPENVDIYLAITEEKSQALKKLKTH